MDRLRNKVAVIIGATTRGGIGEAAAGLFAAEGAQVVVCGRTLEGAEVVADAINGLALRCDVSQESEIEALFDQVIGRFGRLDIAMDVAGAHVSQPVDNFTREAWLKVCEMNLIAPALFIKHAARCMGQGGSIIIVTSHSAELNTVGISAYGSTKAAAERLVQVAGFELAVRGIRVNAVSPAMLDTPMSSPAMQRPGFRQAFVRETPLGRLATVEEIAAAALWLASDECFTTGDRIRVGGGAHLRRFPTPEEFVGD